MKAIILIVTLVSSVLLASKVPVDVLSQVIVETDIVYLKDVVAQASVPAALKPIIEKIELGEAPKQGEIQKITNYAISETIRYKLKKMNKEFLLEEIMLKIPNVVTVTRKNNSITEEKVRSEIISSVKKNCTDCEIEIINLSLQNIKDVEPGASWRLVESAQIPKGVQTFTFEIVKNFNVIKTFFAKGNVRIIKRIPIAKRGLSYGSKIQNEDFEFVNKDVTFVNDSFVSEKELLGSEVALNIQANEIISKRHLKRKFALQRGMPTQLIVKNNHWKIQLGGISQDSAYIGDSVRVLNPITKKIITGIINEEGLVEVY